MPVTPIPMRKITDLLRLYFEACFSQRQIAAATRLSVGVINKYLAAAEAAIPSHWLTRNPARKIRMARRFFMEFV